jgi:hypothetical protein
MQRTSTRESSVAYFDEPFEVGYSVGGYELDLNLDTSVTDVRWPTGACAARSAVGGSSGRHVVDLRGQVFP